MKDSQEKPRGDNRVYIAPAHLTRLKKAYPSLHFIATMRRVFIYENMISPEPFIVIKSAGRHHWQYEGRVFASPDAAVKVALLRYGRFSAHEIQPALLPQH